MTHKSVILDYVKELGNRGSLDEIVPLGKILDTEPIPAQRSSVANSSPSPNLYVETGSKKAIIDNQSQAYPKIRTSASHRTVDSFSAKIDGWKFSRSIGFEDGSVYFQVSTCYPCSICESRITSLHAAIRENNRFQIENSEVGEARFRANASYTVIESDQEVFFVLQYIGSKTPQDIAIYLSTMLGLHITPERGYRNGIRVPIHGMRLSTQGHTLSRMTISS